MTSSKVQNKTKLEHCAAFYLDDERKTKSFMHKFCSTTLQTYKMSSCEVVSYIIERVNIL